MFRRLLALRSRDRMRSRRALAPTLVPGILEVRSLLTGLAAPVGPEALVNTYLTDYQAEPAIAKAPDGRYVVVWQSNTQEGQGNGWGIYGQRYNANGTKAGSEFHVNTYIIGDQVTPAVAMDQNGNFVVVWTSGVQDSNGTAGIYGQRFSSAGAAQGSEFQVNTWIAGSQRTPSVARTESGDFVVAWISDGQGPPPGGGTGPGVASLDPIPATIGVMAQRFNASGVKVGGELTANTQQANPIGFTFDPDVAISSAGSFVIVWTEEQLDNFTNRNWVYSRAFNWAGSPLSLLQLRINPFNNEEAVLPEVDMSADGEFVVAWAGNTPPDVGLHSSIQIRRFNLPATPLTGEIIVSGPVAWDNKINPDVSRDRVNKDFVVTWSLGSQSGDGGDVFQRQYLPDATPKAAESMVNTYTTSDQSKPAVAMDTASNFVVAYQSYQQAGPTTGYDIYARRYQQGGSFALRTGSLAARAAAVPADAFPAPPDLAPLRRGTRRR